MGKNLKLNNKEVINREEAIQFVATTLAELYKVENTTKLQEAVRKLTDEELVLLVGEELK